MRWSGLQASAGRVCPRHQRRAMPLNSIVMRHSVRPGCSQPVRRPRSSWQPMATTWNHSHSINVASANRGSLSSYTVAAFSAELLEGSLIANSVASASTACLLGQRQFSQRVASRPCPAPAISTTQAPNVPKRAATHNSAFERSQFQPRVRSVGRRSTHR